MKTLKQALAMSVALSLAVFTGCSDDDDDNNNTGPTVDEFQTLVDHTDDNFADWTAGWVQGATYVNDNLANLYVIDLRSAADFANGHITGAVNATFGTLLATAADAGSRTIAVTCYTGQNAAFAVMALRMMGFDDAFSMKWGMSAWHSDFMGPWESNSSNAFAPLFVNDAAPALPEMGMPEINTGESTAAGILAARVAATLSAGFASKSATEVFADLDGYEIFNYWGAADYTGFGHIPGAYQLSPGTLTSDQNLTALDPDGPNVVYCWTGQTSAFVGFYLSVLGYEAYSLRFGANAMIHDALVGHDNGWPVGGTGYDFAYTTGQTVDEFEVLKDHTDAAFAGYNDAWVKSATDVYDLMEDLLIVDLRSATDFSAAHIEGSVNATFANLLATVEAENTDDREIAVVCYTGQNAAFATMALRMAGWNAFNMKWGMAAWNSSLTGHWDNAVSDDHAGILDFDPSPELPTHGWPTLNTGLTSAAAILAARVDAVLAEGFGANAVGAIDAIDFPEDYQIFNYWGAADYETLGHLPFSLQLTPGSLTSTQNLSAFDPAGTNLVYCWTGQTSAFVSVYLNVLGYDAKSIRFGINSFAHSAIDGSANQWVGAVNDYPVVND
jgi:rhodanese-related sulfurtransferase